MSKKFIAVVIASVLIVGGGAYVFFGMNKEDAAAPAVAGVKNESSSDAKNTMNQGTSTNSLSTTIAFTKKGFSPQTVTVKQGATVTVKNDSTEKVQFASNDHPTHKLETEMNLRELSPGESGMFIVTRVGSWGFHDHLNPAFTGTLVVTN